MYRSEAMGEYFAAQGMGEYLQAAAGMGKVPWIREPRKRPGRPGTHATPYLPHSRLSGMGEYFAGTGGALVDWARQEEQEHPGIFGLGEFFVPGMAPGMGEYFSQNGLGADDVTAQADMERYGGYAVGGALVGALGALLLKKSKLAGLGIGLIAGLAAAYFVPPATITVTPAT